ncbi:MAG TPA: hypothetical protein VN836_07935 [Verrucomicrobiae bacterium]|nr:hypothetical protein [Verrucomicrobiae bacterium]
MWRTWRAFKFLFTGPIILVFLVIVNLMTSPGHWWVQWAALGIGLVWVLSLLRVLRMMILLGGLAALIAYLRKK